MSKTPQAIFTSDWHLSLKPPSCRLENYEEWWERQLECVAFVLDYRRNMDCPLFICGDIFDEWHFTSSLSNSYISQLLLLLKNHIGYVKTIAGQHDMSNNTLETIDKTAYNLLDVFLDCDINNEVYKYKGVNYTSYPYGVDIEESGDIVDGSRKHVSLIHKLIYEGKSPFVGDDPNGNVEQIVSKLLNSNVIVAGDNHHSFETIVDGKLVINCGCMTRRTVGFIDYQPSFVVWYGGLDYEKVHYPTDKDRITDKVKQDNIENRARLDTFTKLILSKQNDKTEQKTFIQMLGDYRFDEKLDKQTAKVISDTVDFINEGNKE